MPSIVPRFAPPPVSDRPCRIPVSNCQEYLWDKIESGDHAASTMNIPIAIGLKGTIVGRDLETAVNDLINRTEILRTNFLYLDGEKSQVIHEGRRFCLEVKDYRRANRNDREEWMRAHKQKLAERVFDFGKDILIRGCLFRMENDTATAFFVVHHFVFDGYSKRPFVESLLALYKARVAGTGAPQAPPCQYAEFALWERSLPGELAVSNLKYWEGKLLGSHALPRLEDALDDAPRGKNAIMKFVITGYLRDLIQKAARSKNSSLFVGLCTVFVAALMKWKSTDDIVVWFPCVQRETAELSNLIGPIYVNLPLRICITGDPDFGEMMEVVRTCVFDAIEHQWIGYAQLSQIAGKRQPLGFNFTNAGERMPSAGYSDKDRGRPFYLVKGGVSRPEKHPSELLLAVANTKDGLKAAFSYDTECFGKNKMKAMIMELCELAHTWSQNPTLPWSVAVSQGFR